MNVRNFIAAAITGLSAFAVQGFAQASDCTWQATRKISIDTITITVKGVCQEPTPGYTLTLDPVTLQKPDPSTLTLVLAVVAPTGIEPQHVVKVPVEYSQTFVIPRPVPTKVTVWDNATTINVADQVNHRD